MPASRTLITDNELFSCTQDDSILVLRQKRHIHSITDNIDDIFSFYQYLDQILTSRTYKGLLMLSARNPQAWRDHKNFWCNVLNSKRRSPHLDRYINIVNTLFLTLSKLGALTVYAGSGSVSLFHLNLALTADYRLVAADTVFENLDAGLGVVTKGSGYYLPRLLGVRKAAEVLQWRSFTAEEALEMGLVDRVVDTERLEEAALAFLRDSLGRTATTLLAVRKLLKCDLAELQRTLELEDRLIKERFDSEDFRQAFQTQCREMPE